VEGQIVELLRRYRWPIIGFGLVVVVVGFLAFRPDKLFVDDAVDESLDDAFAPSVATTTAPPVSTTTTAVPVAPEDGNSTTPSTSTTTPEAPSSPTAVTGGAFYGIDHSAEGTATVYEQDGRFVLRFEDDTDIQNGPDLYVWVLPSEDYEGGTPPTYIDLGKIKGNIGGQNYELPPEFDPAVHRFVLVWCLRFSTPFAAAPLA
jgi:hypothetical protein